MTETELIALAKETAIRSSLPPELICAICEQESGWNPWAMRYESQFMSRYVAPLYANGKISATEAYARSFSWGLMQVMGQTARENGFGLEFLSMLCDPGTGIEEGCGVFRHKLAAAKGDVEKALLLWNGGGNADYPKQVLARVDKYKDGGSQ